MDRVKFADGVVELLYVSLLIEERVLVLLLDKEIELVVAAGDHRVAECPLAEDDGMRMGIDGEITQGISPDNIAGEEIRDRFEEGVVRRSRFAVWEGLEISALHILVEPVAASLDIVLQNLYPVEGRDGLAGGTFVFGEGLTRRGLHYVHLSAQYLYEKVAITARRLKEPRIDMLCLVFDEVEHSIHFPGRGENFSVVCNPLLRLHLTVATFLRGQVR